MSTVRRGTRLGEYVVEGPLWPVAGGYWWRVRHHALDDVRAAVLTAETPELGGRLAGLARLQDQLDAEAALPVRGIDAEHTPPYLVLQTPRGEWLHDRLQRGPCGSAEARLIVAGIAAALEPIHAAGLGHGHVGVEAVHLGEGARVRLGLAGCGPRADAPAASAADDVRALAGFTFALLTGCTPAGVIGPADLGGLPDWACRVIRRAQGLDGGYGGVADVRADLDAGRREDSGIRFVTPAGDTPPAPGTAPLRIAPEPPPQATPSTPQTRNALVPGAPRPHGPWWWRAFWFPPRAAAGIAGFFLPLAAHLAWIGLLAWGVHAWVAGETARTGAVVGAAHAPDADTQQALAWFLELTADATEDRTSTAFRLQRAAESHPVAFRAAARAYSRELQRRPAGWPQSFARLGKLQGTAARMTLSELESIVHASEGPVDPDFTERIAQLRRVWVGERF